MKKESKEEKKGRRGQGERKYSFFSVFNIQETEVGQIINVWKNYSEAGERDIFWSEKIS